MPSSMKIRSKTRENIINKLLLEELTFSKGVIKAKIHLVRQEETPIEEQEEPGIVNASWGSFEIDTSQGFVVPPPLMEKFNEFVQELVEHTESFIFEDKMEEPEESLEDQKSEIPEEVYVEEPEGA